VGVLSDRKDALVSTRTFQEAFVSFGQKAQEPGGTGS